MTNLAVPWRPLAVPGALGGSRDPSNALRLLPRGGRPWNNDGRASNARGWCMTNVIKFGTDGWRAIIAEDFTFANVRALAASIARYLTETRLGERGVIVGYDTRFGSDRFAESVAQV